MTPLAYTVRGCWQFAEGVGAVRSARRLDDRAHVAVCQREAARERGLVLGRGRELDGHGLAG